MGAKNTQTNITGSTALKDVVFDANKNDYKIQKYVPFKALGGYTRLKENSFYDALKDQFQSKLHLQNGAYNHLLSDLKQKAGIENNEPVTIDQATKLTSLFQRELCLPNSVCRLECDDDGRSALLEKTGKTDLTPLNAAALR